MYKRIASAGTVGLTVYSDNTAAPKFKKFSGTTTWDVGATTIATTGFTPGVFKATRLIPQTLGDDIMMAMSDANRALYTVCYQASVDAVYTTPSGPAFSQHGTNGSAI